ncbi:MAG: hypothetical protein HY363_05500 [Candidatus Aenigmarchaeota archaeon]|nr:hypothetical protein [Candidatus Aenigmarchaeota archaeon]
MRFPHAVSATGAHIALYDVAKNTEVANVPNLLAGLSWTSNSITLAKRKKEGGEFIRLKTGLAGN